MIPIEPRNVTDYKVTVTNSATNLYALMDTASSDKGAQNYYYHKKGNSLILNPEDGDIRYLIGGTPTSTVGILVSSGTKEYIPGIDLTEMKLIRTGGADVAVTAVPYRAEPGESPGSVAYDVTLEAGDIEIGAVELKDASSDQRAAIDDRGNLAVRSFSQLVPEEYDYIDCTWTGSNLTGVVYKLGGSGGATVATLNITYDGSDNIDTITKT